MQLMQQALPVYTIVCPGMLSLESISKFQQVFQCAPVPFNVCLPISFPWTAIASPAAILAAPALIVCAEAASPALAAAAAEVAAVATAATA